MTELIVKLEHLAGVRNLSSSSLGFCRRDARKWCAANGIDWDAFRHHGINADVLIATGDALALAVVEVARAQQTREMTDGRQ